MLEIELKASLDPEGAQGLEDQLPALGLTFSHWTLECDTYYQAPDRDFKKTDEALRLRQYETKEESQVYLTYKGPKLDPLSNTRKEIETLVCDAQELDAILVALGYQPILAVKKKRRYFKGSGSTENITLCLDQVDGLGSFVEVEYLAPDNLSDEKRESIRNRLLSLLSDLGVSPSKLTRQSYLELLIASMTS